MGFEVSEYTRKRNSLRPSKTTAHIAPDFYMELQVYRFWLVLLTSGMMLLLAGCGTTRAPVSDQSSTAQYKRYKTYYRVSKGETLYSIAWRTHLDFRELAAWNGIKPPQYRIYPGQRLRLKPPKPIRVSVARKKPQNPERKKTPIKKKATIQKKNEQSVANTKTALKIKWNWPTNGAVIRAFSKADRSRQGIRIAGRAGQHIRAAASGKVVYSGSGLIGYGNLIIIKHNSTYLSAYAHNRRILVKEGEAVSRGTVIAEMGRAADDKVPLLHFEIRRKGVPINPVALLPER